MITTDKLRLKIFFNMLPIIFLILIYYTQYLEGQLTVFIPLFFTMVWILQSIMIVSPSKIFCYKEDFWWIVYFGLSLCMVIFGFSNTNINFLITRIPHYTIPIMGYFVLRYYNLREKQIILYIFCVIFFFNLLYNIGLSIVLPEIFVDKDNTEESIKLCTSLNVASTAYIAVCLWFIGTLLMVIANINSRKWKNYFIISIVLMSYYICVVNSRGTASLLLILMIVLFTLSIKAPNNGTNKRLYYLASFTLLIIVFCVFLVPLLSFALDYIESARLKDRLEDLMTFQKSGGDSNQLSSGGSMGQRIKLAQTSLNTFFSSPINMLIGIGDQTQAYGGNLVKSGIGSHSEFIDVLARNGIIGAIVFYNILKQYYNKLFSISNLRNINKYLFWIFVIYIIYGFLNTVFQPTMEIFIFMILPIVVKLLDSKIKQTN